MNAHTPGGCQNCQEDCEGVTLCRFHATAPRMLKALKAAASALGRLMGDTEAAERLAHERAHSIERLERDNAALLEVLESLYACNVWYGQLDDGDKARLRMARAAIRQAKGESNG